MLPADLARSVMRMCVAVLVAKDDVAQVMRAEVRNWLWAQVFIESARPTQDLCFHTLALDLLELEATDPEGARRAFARVGKLIHTAQFKKLPVPAAVLYLLHAVR
jgi:hypothetical protein